MKDNKNVISQVAEEVAVNIATTTIVTTGSWLAKLFQALVTPPPTQEEKELLKPKE